MSREVLDKKHIMQDGIRYNRCQGLSKNGDQCTRIAKKGADTCGQNHGGSVPDLYIKKQGLAPVARFDELVKKAKQDRSLRDFDDYLANIRAMIDDVKLRSADEGLTGVDLEKIAIYCDLITKFLVREAKVRNADIHSLTTEDIRRFMSEVTGILNETCSVCPKRTALTTKLRGINIGTTR